MSSVGNGLAPLLLWPLTACGLLACAPPDRGSLEQPVTNSVVDDLDLNVVAVSIGGMPGCTGTLIGKRVVMTAAHCVNSDLPQSVFFGTGPIQGGQTIGVIHAEPHPLYNPDGLIDDVGLLLLGEDAPTLPAVLGTQPFTDSMIGMQLRLVGFGETHQSDTSPLFTKHVGFTAIDSFTDDKIAFHANPSQTCSGDSGGPAFMTMDGLERVVGITTSGAPDCAASAHDTRVDRFVESFIQPFLDTETPGSVPTGGRCWTDSSCSWGSCLPSDDDKNLRYCTRYCQRQSDCPASMKCEPVGDAYRCHYRSPTPGAFGTSCETDLQCASGICGRVGPSATGSCTTPCTAQTDCSGGQSCAALTTPLAASFSGCVSQGCSLGSFSRRRGGDRPLLCVLLLLAWYAGSKRRARTASHPSRRET